MTKKLQRIASPVHTVKLNGFHLIFDPTQPPASLQDRRVYFAKHGSRGLQLFGLADKQDIMDAKVSS